MVRRRFELRGPRGSAGLLLGALGLLMSAAGASAGESGGCSYCTPVGEGTVIGNTFDAFGRDLSTSCGRKDALAEWFCYVPSCTGIAVASTCGAPTNMDTTVAVFHECELELACNDDFCGEPGPLDGRKALVAWPVQAGEVYYVRVAGNDFVEGIFQLDLACGQGGLTFFLEEESFLSTLAQGNAGLLAGVGFEEAMVPPGDTLPMNDPLNSNTNNGIFVPGDIALGLFFQSNLDGPGVMGPNPRGTNGLLVNGPGFMGLPEVAVVAGVSPDSFDVLTLPPPFPRTHAVALNLVSFEGGGVLQVRAFNAQGQLIGLVTVPAGAVPTFLGIIAPPQVGAAGTGIGRINVFDGNDEGPTGGFEGPASAMSYSFNACPADLNGDDMVNPPDIAGLLGAWGPNQGNPADLSADGLVNSVDLAFLLGSWGPCPDLMSPCGMPGAGNCCEANGTPGCDHASCCDEVCAIDPFCCEFLWDDFCRKGALLLCSLCGG